MGGYRYMNVLHLQAGFNANSDTAFSEEIFAGFPAGRLDLESACANSPSCSLLVL